MVVVDNLEGGPGCDGEALRGRENGGGGHSAAGGTHRIAVQANDEEVAVPLCFFQRLDVTNVEEIKRPCTMEDY